jgi:hypothetical protein
MNFKIGRRPNSRHHRKLTLSPALSSYGVRHPTAAFPKRKIAVALPRRLAGAEQNPLCSKQLARLAAMAGPNAHWIVSEFCNRGKKVRGDFRPKQSRKKFVTIKSYPAQSGSNSGRSQM